MGLQAERQWDRVTERYWEAYKQIDPEELTRFNSLCSPLNENGLDPFCFSCFPLAFHHQTMYLVVTLCTIV